MLNDSGKRQEFETGAVRDAAGDKTRPDLISPLFMLRMRNYLKQNGRSMVGPSTRETIESAKDDLSKWELTVPSMSATIDYLARAAETLSYVVHCDELSKRKFAYDHTPADERTVDDEASINVQWFARGLSPLFLQRLGMHLMRGSLKYSEMNWALGIPIKRSYASLKRHIDQVTCGDMDEDHHGAVACNLMFIIHTLEAIERKILPATLNDIYDWSKGVIQWTEEDPLFGGSYIR